MDTIDASRLFYEVHEGLPREAPGDEQSTLRALNMMTALPAEPSILDIGCGPGAQTLALAAHSSAHITAVDVHQPFLDELARRARDAGVSERITTVRSSMLELQMGSTFDVIWSEGAIYIAGFEQGLRLWRPLLKPGGYIAVTELSWIKPEPPHEVAEYWRSDYPGMGSIEENLGHLHAAGYREAGHFVLPPSSWWEPYYRPMEARVAQLRSKYEAQPEAQRLLDTKTREIEMYRKYGDWYGYVFYIMQDPAGAASNGL